MNRRKKSKKQSKKKTNISNRGRKQVNININIDNRKKTNPRNSNPRKKTTLNNPTNPYPNVGQSFLSSFVPSFIPQQPQTNNPIIVSSGSQDNTLRDNLLLQLRNDADNNKMMTDQLYFKVGNAIANVNERFKNISGEFENTNIKIDDVYDYLDFLKPNRIERADDDYIPKNTFLGLKKNTIDRSDDNDIPKNTFLRTNTIERADDGAVNLTKIYQEEEKTPVLKPESKTVSEKINFYNDPLSRNSRPSLKAQEIPKTENLKPEGIEKSQQLKLQEIPRPTKAMEKTNKEADAIIKGFKEADAIIKGFNMEERTPVLDMAEKKEILEKMDVKVENDGSRNVAYTDLLKKYAEDVSDEFKDQYRKYLKNTFNKVKGNLATDQIIRGFKLYEKWKNLSDDKKEKFNFNQKV